MTFAHISDTHLGYRAYSRTTPQGFNQREVDVMQTFRSCLNAMAEREPEVVVHSGDLFHVVRPSNATIHHTFRSISEFQTKRKGLPFILIGGNHDTPRMAESGNILQLFAEIPGVMVKTGKAAAIDLPDHDLEVLCVPSNSILSEEKIDWVPQVGRKFSLLTLHGLARQAIPHAGQFDVSDARHEKWTYVAMGDFHIHASYGKNVCYAGSTDFTSTNIWEEAPKPKGWVWFDSDAGKLEYQRVATRKVVDLPKIDAQNLSTEELREKILANAKWDAEDQPIVRQRVLNVHPETRGQVGSNLVRELNGRCLNYLLRLYLPEAVVSDTDTHRGQAITLEKSWEDHIGKAELPGGTDRKVVTDLGLKLLKEAAERAADPAQA